MRTWSSSRTGPTSSVPKALPGPCGATSGSRPACPSYPVKPSGISFTIDPKLADIRPVLGAAVIRGVSFDDESIQSIMSLQESLHWAVGRGRSKVAIGIHDLDTVKPPFHYIASPRSREFIPLDFTEKMTMDEILEKHPKGRDYAKIVKDFPLFPLIVDDDDHVLSFPPIINGERTRVTIDTKNILLDTTGTDKRAVSVAVNIICTAMAEAGATIESVEIGGVQTPTLAPAERTVSVKECSRLLGVEPDRSINGRAPQEDAVRCRTGRCGQGEGTGALLPGRYHARLGPLRGRGDRVRVRQARIPAAQDLHRGKTPPGAGQCRPCPRSIHAGSGISK